MTNKTVSRKRFAKVSENIGSVSTATLRSQDLIPAFIYEAQRQHLSRVDRNELRKIAKRVRKIENGRYGEQDAYWADETADWDLEALTGILNNCAPTGFYFGSHPGDGADFGYWLSESFAEDFDGLKVDDTSEVPPGFSGEVLHINDHGNMSLYRATRGRLRELWAIV